MTRVIRLLGSVLDPGVWLHLFRILHFYGYSHVKPLRAVTLGDGVRLAPNVSLRNGERITIGPGAHIGENVCLWAGNREGRIDIGAKTAIGPGTFVTASMYGTEPGIPVVDQPTVERDVRIGRDAFVGARVVITAGVTIGDECVVGAGSVVTKSVPAGAFVAGVPATVRGWRRPPAAVTAETGTA